MAAVTKPCPSCGARSEMAAERCVACGRAFGSIVPAPQPHDVSVAAMLAIMMPGAGQFYNRQTKRGVVMLALFIVPLIVGLIFWKPWCLLITAIMWCVSVVDASIIAGQRIRREAA